MPIFNRKAAQAALMTDGIHAVTVVKAESKTSQSGNEMIRLTLEDIISHEKVRCNVVFAESAGFSVEACLASLDLELPDTDQFVAEPRHFQGRTGFISTKYEDTKDFGAQVRVKWITAEKAFKQAPELEHANIPENDPLLLPAITASSPSQRAKPRSVPRLQSWNREEVEAEQARQTAAMLANKEHLNQELDIPPEPPVPDDIKI